MTDTIEHGRLQAAQSLQEAISNFDFGTNTGRALELRDITSPEELALRYPDIAQKVFPTDQFGNIIGYRPADRTKQIELRNLLKERELIYTIQVNEREDTTRNQERTVPVMIESKVSAPPTGIINQIENKWGDSSNTEKLSVIGIVVSLLRFI